MSRELAFVDIQDTEKRKKPDRSSFCRASAQDGDRECREIMHLSTFRIPKSAEHPTDHPFVGLRPRTVIPNVERTRILCSDAGHKHKQEAGEKPPASCLCVTVFIRLLSTVGDQKFAFFAVVDENFTGLNDVMPAADFQLACFHFFGYVRE